MGGFEVKFNIYATNILLEAVFPRGSSHNYYAPSVFGVLQGEREGCTSESHWEDLAVG